MQTGSQNRQLLQILDKRHLLKGQELRASWLMSADDQTTGL